MLRAASDVLLSASQNLNPCFSFTMLDFHPHIKQRLKLSLLFQSLCLR